jgi:hypothetical protein
MGKKKTKDERSREIRMAPNPEPPASPAHAASREVERRRADPNHSSDARGDDPRAALHANRDTSDKVHRDAAAGTFAPGARVPEMPRTHEVLAVDANNPGHAEALRRPASSAPNGPVPTDGDRSAVSILDADDLSRLTE